MALIFISPVGRNTILKSDLETKNSHSNKKDVGHPIRSKKILALLSYIIWILIMPRYVQLLRLAGKNYVNQRSRNMGSEIPL